MVLSMSVPMRRIAKAAAFAVIVRIMAGNYSRCIAIEVSAVFRCEHKRGLRELLLIGRFLVDNLLYTKLAFGFC